MEWPMKTMVSAMVVLLACGVGGVCAQTPAPGEAQVAAPAGLTHLHLSAEGTVSELPDALVGDLTAEATSPSAVKVNAMMAQGMKDAQAVEGIEARALGYAVNQVDLDEGSVSVRPHPRRMGWTAQQTLEIRGKDGERLSSLVGKLQDEGLAVASLDWQLSPELGREARDGAMVKALQALRMRADKAAQALGLKVDQIQDVRVDMPEPMPVRPMMAMQMKAGPPPEATAAPQDMTSEVSADIVLRP
jgi:uncharacterized protein YggE